MNRRKVRRLALSLSFGAQFQKDTPAQELLADFTENGGESDEYVKELYLGVSERSEELDGYISGFLKGWKLERISKMTLAILRLTVYEILYTDTPDSVVANEAVELAKEYAESGAASFVNGVIANVIKNKASETV